MPLHELLDHAEVLFLEWRFSRPRGVDEERAAVYFAKVLAEVDRRRRRRLRSVCTCAQCFEVTSNYEGL